MDPWSLLQTCAAAAWAPHWGDPDALGIFLTLLYVTGTLFTCWKAVLVWRGGSGQRWFWTLAALYMTLLTINKQLDLQSFLTQTGRCMARAEGWYRDRRGVQEVTSLLLIGVMAAAGLILILRAWRGNRLMLAGLCLLTTYIGLRILSFHHMDTLLRTPVFGLGLARIIELSSLLLINLAASAKRPLA